MTVAGIRDLDPFRSRQAQDVLGRLRKARDAHQRNADLMWAGTLAALFSDHELGLADDMGFLSPRDRDLVAQARGGPQARHQVKVSVNGQVAPSEEGPGA